ncbi:MAG: hypothetical protein AB8I08_19195 [Sandaracinaceae bacterium]
MIEVSFKEVLGEGLRVRRTDTSGHGALRLGDPVLHERYEVMATHPDPARNLLLARPVSEAMLADDGQMCGSGGIALAESGHVTSASVLRQRIRGAVGLAGALSALA